MYPDDNGHSRLRNMGSPLLIRFHEDTFGKRIVTENPTLTASTVEFASSFFF
jgi:hypothetical protein